MNSYEEILYDKIKKICESYDKEPTGGFITGDGPIPCNIMFIGEAPGKNEVIQGKPFVGMAGKTFEEHLNSIGLLRENIRVTNTCFFRPITIKKSGNRETISNRTPKTSEIKLFKDVLSDEVKMVNPKIIVTMGNVPLKSLTNFKSIGECHGNLTFCEYLKRPVFPMYHPSSLTYTRTQEFKEIYKNDWLKLKNELTKLGII